MRRISVGDKVTNKDGYQGFITKKEKRYCLVRSNRSLREYKTYYNQIRDVVFGNV